MGQNQVSLIESCPLFGRFHRTFLMCILQGEEREGMTEEIKVVAVADPAKQVRTNAGPEIARRTIHLYYCSTQRSTTPVL